MSFTDTVPVGSQLTLPNNIGVKTALTGVSVSNIQILPPDPIVQINLVRWRCNMCRLKNVPNYATIDLSLTDSDSLLLWEERVRVGSDVTRPTIKESITIDRKFEPATVLKHGKGLILVANYIDGGDNVQLTASFDYWLSIGISMPFSTGLSTYP